MSKVRPIIFSAPMVRAILGGRKTQTRRIVKPQPMLADKVVYNNGEVGEWRYMHEGWRWRNEEIYEGDPFRCPYGGVGGVLWVREVFHTSPHFTCLYRADYDDGALLPKVVAHGGWKPSIHMPRRVSRIALEITGIRVERLQEISEADAQAEGARCVDAVTGREVLFPIGSRIGSYRVHYRAIWESIHGAGSWESNPFVWVIEFRSLADGR